MELGKRIAEIRKEHSLTQEGLAEICSVTRQTISNWENGKSYPDLETLVLISDTFDVSLDVMLKGDRKMVSEITKEQKHGKYFAAKIIVAIVVTLALAVGGYFYIMEHESYIPYEESGITAASDNGSMYTDKNYSCIHYFSFVTETVDGEHHCVVFTYLTSSIYSKHIKKKFDSTEPIAVFSEWEEQSIDDNGKLLDDIVTEVYYLSEKYVVENDLLNKKHSELIPFGTPVEEQNKIIKQMKADSTLLWKRK